MASTSRVGTSHRNEGEALFSPATLSGRGFNLALGLFLSLLALYSLLQSALFEVQAIEVIGARQLSEEEVASVAGLAVGSNLFALDLASARDRLEALPVVRSAEVRRAFPGRVVVSVAERIPIAYVSTEAGFWAVDSGGTALFVDEGVELSLPLITAAPPPEAEAGATVEAPHLSLALRFIDALSPAGMALLSEVRLDRDGVLAYTEDRATVRLGAEGDMAERARVLEGLLQQIGARRLSVAEIDLRHPKNPVFTEKR